MKYILKYSFIFVLVHSYVGQKKELDFGYKVIEFPKDEYSTLTFARFWFNDCNSSIRLDTLGRIKTFSLESNKLSYRFNVFYNDSARSSNAIIEAIKVKGKDTITEYVFFNEKSKYIQGKTINNVRVGTWKMFDDKENVIGEVRFGTRKKNGYQENCIPEIFNCSYIIEVKGNFKEIVEFNWRRIDM
jgi:hypothetical protein